MGEMEELMEELVEISTKILKDDKVVDALATFCWNFYGKLEEKGFPEKIALEILLAMIANQSFLSMKTS